MGCCLKMKSVDALEQPTRLTIPSSSFASTTNDENTSSLGIKYDHLSYFHHLQPFHLLYSQFIYCVHFVMKLSKHISLEEL